MVEARASIRIMVPESYLNKFFDEKCGKAHLTSNGKSRATLFEHY